ncbi:uncharacterized protein LAESUDRAFT_737961 [Laetiporus sulphureus 93-53]|uniref:Uncharacterized protein n=1 Tax=Laetiporus sulphureus 93-53 TaxID=1314785 RepID=A0A165D6Q0_9APHY|nr:uncharacterized protein LAESUDRAFT_737961 [Laetiporus sulphureus 93-53]KZT04254.1 hypothetical protein LAESUDRAFT_737961 [Laetiporus sulphureus 93-53]
MIKWTHHLSPELQAFMWAHGNKHYFISELAQLQDGHLIMSTAWFHHQSHGSLPHDVHVSCSEVTKGQHIYTSFIKAWGDDVSGNQSKQYNEHTNIYFAHANVPHEKLAQEYFINFTSTSQHTSAIKQFDAMMTDTVYSKLVWHVTYDCINQEEILFHMELIIFPADNPQQQAVIKQIEVAGLGVAKTSGVKDKLAEHWIVKLLRYAKVLLIAGDIHQDTPIEVLHTYLLGADKYAWHYLHTTWTPKQCEAFTIKLQSLFIDGLTISPLHSSYIMQSCNDLIGKHLKALQQLMIFHLDESLSLLWVPEIDNMDKCLSDVQILVSNIFVKPKLHILSHLTEDICRHGSLILYATEIFECFNAIFWIRDIVWTFADLAHFKHQVSSRCSIRKYFDNIELKPGMVHCKAKSQAVTYLWQDLHIHVSSAAGWYKGHSVISKYGDYCLVESCIAAELANRTIIDQIVAILAPAAAHLSEKVQSLINILFIVDVQHNCFDKKCKASGQCAIRQEHTETMLAQAFIENTDDTHFLLNLHTLHNAVLLRKILPHSLTKLISYLQDRIAEHKKMAAALSFTLQCMKRPH